MIEDEFWLITANINQKALLTGDENAAISPLRQKLSSLTKEEIQSYEEILSNLLYQIDGEEFANNAGEAGKSGDGFLYCRCYVVARGKTFYEKVLASQSAIPISLEQWFEPILSVAAESWAMAMGCDPDDWEYSPSVSYETGSNVSLWNSSDTEQKMLSEEDRFFESKIERAVARAGHAFRGKNYKYVVMLLEPHEKNLSTKQNKMLVETRGKNKSSPS
jgi:Protein of unknown function (DUF4240)